MKMKKTMMMAMMTVLALSVKAGVIQWGTAGGSMTATVGGLWPANSVPLTTMVYLVLDSARTAVLAAAEGGTFDDSMAGVLEGKQVESTKGVINAHLTPDNPNGNSLAPTTFVDVFLLVFIPGDVGNPDGYYAYTSALPAGIGTSASDVTPAAFGNTDWIAGGGWQPIDDNGGGPITVPEPASALLALAGVGLLVGRKRRS